MKTTIDVLMADDHELIRRGFEVLLNGQERIRLVGAAADGQQLLDAVDRLQPHLVITDIRMPVLDGIEVTRRLARTYPHIGVIALSMFNEEYLIVEMLEAGAHGYLLKNATKEVVTEAVETVYNGGTYFCSATSKKLTALLAASRFQGHQGRLRPALSPKEIEIMRLICQQLSSKQIASKLGYTPRTVENYREKIQEKIGAQNMVGIAVYAMKHQLFQP